MPMLGVHKMLLPDNFSTALRLQNCRKALRYTAHQVRLRPKVDNKSVYSDPKKFGAL